MTSETHVIKGTIINTIKLWVSFLSATSLLEALQVESIKELKELKEGAEVTLLK